MEGNWLLFPEQEPAEEQVPGRPGQVFLWGGCFDFIVFAARGSSALIMAVELPGAPGSARHRTWQGRRLVWGNDDRFRDSSLRDLLLPEVDPQPLRKCLVAGFADIDLLQVGLLQDISPDHNRCLAPLGAVLFFSCHLTVDLSLGRNIVRDLLPEHRINRFRPVFAVTRWS